MAEELAWLGFGAIRRLLETGRIGPGDVPDTHRRRIARLNPYLAAYVHVDLNATASSSGPMAGSTVAIKDTQEVAGQPWRMGSPRFRDRAGERDELTTGRLRSAGAALIGKTNVPELAAAVDTSSPIAPPCVNPHRLGYTAGGSSGGSAAAVAAGLCTGATGDDMGGSIRIPASVCGVMGLRPSPWSVPVDEPDPTHLLARGPIARTAADLRVMYEVLTAAAAPALPRLAQRALRVGVVDSTQLGMEASCRFAVDQVAGAFDDAGCAVERIDWNAEPALDAYRIIRPVTLGAFPGRPEDYGPGVRARIVEGRATNAVDYHAAQIAGLRGGREVSRRLDEELDLIVTPTLGLAPMPLDQVPAFLTGAYDRYVQFVLPVSFAGLPSISLPGPPAGGLPIGVQLIGRRGGEWLLISLAEDLEERGFRFQRPPEL